MIAMTNNCPGVLIQSSQVSSLLYYTGTFEDYTLLSDSMEFVPAPAVHRVLCADCGGSRLSVDKALHLSHHFHAIQEIQLFPIPQTCALIALGIRKSFCSFANHCSPVSVSTSRRAYRSKVCTSSPPQAGGSVF